MSPDATLASTIALHIAHWPMLMEVKQVIKMTKKNNDPFGFKKAIDTSVIDKLTPKELDEAMVAAGLGLSRDDFSDDGADLQDLKEIYEGNGS